jgi:two-component system, chemotaxis family, chemotaxis protein CheY
MERQMSMGQAKESLSVLIVDDSEHVRALLTMLIKKEGITQVHQVTDGEAAIASYKQLKPSLVFLDNMLPKLSGMEVLKQIRLFDPLAKVIMISAISNPEVILDAKQNGASYYIIKPYSSQKVIEVLRKLLDITPENA